MRGGIVQFPRDARGDEVSVEENFVRFTEPVDCAVVSKVFPDFGFAFDSHYSLSSFTFTSSSSYSRRVDATECPLRMRERERERERNELWRELFRYKDRSTNYFNLIKI